MKCLRFLLSQLGKAVRTLREERGYSQEELAERPVCIATTSAESNGANEM